MGEWPGAGLQLKLMARERFSRVIDISAGSMKTLTTSASLRSSPVFERT